MAAAFPEDYKYAQFLNLLNPSKEHKLKIGIAIFGLGRAGTIHFQNLISNPRVELLYVIEERAERRNELSKVHASTKFLGVENVQQVWTDKCVQAVVIATPTDLHQNLVLDALNAGKGVFCEKPLANDISGVKLCYETAAKLKLPLLCAFNRRFDPSFENVKIRCDKGEVGPIHVVKTCSRDSPLPSMDYLKISNGIFHDCAVHDLDLATWILGEYPIKVYANAVARRPEIGAIGDHDTVAIHLSFKSGAMAIIDLSRFACYGYDQRLEVFGPKGMLSCSNQIPMGVNTYTNVGISQPPIFYSFASRYEEAYKNELNHFLNVLEGKEDLKIKGEETVAICRIALACEESVKTGIPVYISYD